MQITGAFLADYAEIVDQKLNVKGGILDFIFCPKSGQVNDQGEKLLAVIYIVTLMQATPDDHQKPYRLKTEIVDPTGNVALFADGEVSVDAHSGENRFWVTKIGLAAPHGGRITFLQSIGGGEPIAIPVELHVE
jgi:hypothetical protein